MTLVSDLSDLSDKLGAPVFALTGYAAASHGIPRGGCLPLCGLARGIRFTTGENNAPDRYLLFFAKLFFHPGITHGQSGGCQGDSQSP